MIVACTFTSKVAKVMILHGKKHVLRIHLAADVGLKVTRMPERQNAWLARAGERELSISFTPAWHTCVMEGIVAGATNIPTSL